MTVTAVRPVRRPTVPGLVARTEALLRAGIPLTLLLDLGDPAGPRSEALLREERRSRPERPAAREG